VWNILAQEDNKLNRKIALATKRDSYQMKSIALLTMIFLPGTFVAVRSAALSWSNKEFYLLYLTLAELFRYAVIQLGSGPDQRRENILKTFLDLLGRIRISHVNCYMLVVYLVACLGPKTG
jgi:hypothetical protein